MKRLAAILLAVVTGFGLVPLTAGPAWATDSTVLGGYARKDGLTNQLRDSEHPNHVDCINGVCATHTGHGTASRTISADSTNTIYSSGGLVWLTTSTATGTATGTASGSGTSTASSTFAAAFTATWTETGTGTRTYTYTETSSSTAANQSLTPINLSGTVTGSQGQTATASRTSTNPTTQTTLSLYTRTGTSTKTGTGTETMVMTATQSYERTATGTGTLSAAVVDTATATDTSALVANNPTVHNAATLAQGTTNVTFSTGTATTTTTSANVGDSPLIHVATSTQTQTLAFNLPNATKTATVPGTATFVATDFGTTATGTGKIPLTTSEGLLNRLIIPWQYTGPISPNVDSSYDVGTTDYKYQDGYFSGTVSAGAFDGPGIVKGIYSATNSGGNVTANEGGAWVTVASVSVTASSSDIMAFGSVSVTSAYDNETCLIRLVSDGSSVFGPSYTRTRSNYTYFEAMAVVGHMSNVSPSTITLQLSSGGSASGHTCTVMQSEGALVVQVAQ